MAELLRSSIRYIFEIFFLRFYLPQRAIFVLIVVIILLWLAVRVLLRLWRYVLKHWQGLTIFLTTPLLFLEYLLVKIARRKAFNLPKFAYYGEYMHKIAYRLGVSCQKVNKKQKWKPLLRWIIVPSLLLLFLIPVWHSRFRSTNSTLIHSVDSITLWWSSFEGLLLTRKWEQKNYYMDFTVHTVEAGDTINSLTQSFGVWSSEDIIWANKSKYPLLSQNHVEIGWVLVIPIRKPLSIPLSQPTPSPSPKPTQKPKKR